MIHSNYFHLILLICSTSLVAAQLTKVDLLNPTFTSISIDKCIKSNGGGAKDEVWNCTLSLWTRAAKYRVSNILTVESKESAVIERIGNWSRPVALKDQASFIYANSSTNGTALAGSISNSRKTLGTKAAFPYIRCEAKALLGDDRKFICARDSIMFFRQFDCDPEAEVCPKDFLHFNLVIGFPLSAMAVWQQKGTRFIFAIDTIGQLYVSEFYDTEISLPVVAKLKYMLNSLADELAPLFSASTPANNLPRAQVGSFMTEERRNAAAIGLKERLEMTYINAISPYNQRDVQTAGNNNLSRICLSNGYQASNGNQHICLNRGESIPESKSVPNAYIRITAMSHILMDNNQTIENIFYVSSESSEGKLRYFRCRKDARSNYKNETDTILRAVPLSGNISRQQEICGYYEVEDTPNDIVAVFDSKEKCSRQVLFYSNAYEIHALDAFLHRNPAHPTRYESRINFYINAAFHHDGRMYFFSGANTLIIVPVEFDSPECRKLLFNFDSASEAFAHRYLVNMLDLKPSVNMSTLIDYQEFAEGDPDANPPLGLIPSKSSKSGSNVIIISIAFVVGGLILAGIIYVCFIMSGSPTAERRPKSRLAKSKRAPQEKMEHGKTLRSQIQSKIGAPGKSKRSKKSTAKSKSKRSPTSLTTVKVTRGEPIPLTSGATSTDSVAGQKSPGQLVQNSPQNSPKSPISSQKSNSSARKLTPRSPTSLNQASSTPVSSQSNSLKSP